jgi:hypothetical protein
MALLGAAALQIWRENPSPPAASLISQAFSILAESPTILARRWGKCDSGETGLADLHKILQSAFGPSLTIIPYY